MNALELAILFHVIYERKSAEFNYVTRTETRIFDPESPNGKLMIATCQEVLAEPVFTENTKLREAAQQLIDDWNNRGEDTTDIDQYLAWDRLQELLAEESPK